MDDGLARGAANRRGGSHDSDSVFGRTFFPASGLLADRSRPGANIEARPRFNPRSGRVALIAFFDWTSCLFSSGVRWTMVWRGARFNPRSGRVALIAFFDWTSCLFSSGVRWTMVWRGARFNPRSGRVALIAFFFSFLFFFFSGQTANHIVGISFYRIFGDCVKNNANSWLCTAELCLLLRKGELIIDRK